MNKPIHFFLMSMIVLLLLYSCSFFPMNEDTYYTSYHDYPLTPSSPSTIYAIDTVLPFFDWTDAIRITSYHLQVGETPDFSGTLLVDEQTLVTSEYQLVESIDQNKFYYWRVRAKNEKGDWLVWSDTWSFFSVNETKILPSDGASGDYFGNSVSMAANGEHFLVGVIGDDDNGSNSGSVYMYSWSGSSWAGIKNIPPDVEYGDNFGNSVSMAANGEHFLVADYRDDDNGSDSGSVYVY